MPNNSPFDSNNTWWLNPAWPRTGPLGDPANSDYWTDPFTNQRTVAPATPTPFTAAQLGAMSWNAPVFLPPNPFSPANIPASKWLTPLPIFLNSPAQFPPIIPAPRDDAPSDAPEGLLGGIPKMLNASSPVNNPAIDENKGLLGAIEQPLSAAPIQPRLSPFAKTQSTPVAGGSSPDLLGSPPGGLGFPPSGAVPPTRSVLFNHALVSSNSGALDPNVANLDQLARNLGGAELPISKSGIHSVSSPPQLSITPEQWLAAARLLAPNTVDYFTKQLPPAPPFPPTPGKIPSSDNPYAPGAALEAATFLLAPLEGRLATSLAPAARAVEMRAAEAALQAAGLPASFTNLARPAEQVVTAPYGKLSGTLPPGYQAHHLNQDAVFNSLIPQKQGLSVGLKGDIITEPGSPHYEFHQSLEDFWQQYRARSSLKFEMSTNADCGEAVRRALIAYGFSDAQASELAAQAGAQRAAFGLSESAEVPRIPRAIWPRR